MNTTELKKRQALFEVYLSKVNESLDFANHLLSHTRTRMEDISRKIQDVTIKINESRFEVGERINSGTLKGRYTFGQSLSVLLVEFETERDIVDVELKRRLLEVKNLQGKKVGIETMLERCKQQTMLLAIKLESKEQDEWSTSLYAKTNRIKRIRR